MRIIHSNAFGIIGIVRSTPLSMGKPKRGVFCKNSRGGKRRIGAAESRAGGVPLPEHKVSHTPQSPGMARIMDWGIHRVRFGRFCMLI